MIPELCINKLRIMKQHHHIKKYLRETELMDFSHSSIQQLVTDRNWLSLDTKDKIRSVYNFVRDEIKFGYNKDDNMKASEVLEEGYGQCNTKAILLMTLLRAVSIPNRIHAFSIGKQLKKGVIPAPWHNIAPDNILHTWVEVGYNNQWYNLEGVILDKAYLNQLQKQFGSGKGAFCGYGAYTDNFLTPAIDWNENDTYIQHLGINDDYGRFNSPDELLQKHQQDFSFLKKLFYQFYLRKRMNDKIKKIREAQT